jgi:hypothetical protein
MKCVRFFIFSSALILLVTASAKLAVSAGHASILMEPDPIIGVSVKHLIVTVAIIELCIVITCLSKSIMVPIMLIAWLSTNLLAYRIILALIGYSGPCHCLGNLTENLHIPAQTTDTVMKIILSYLLAGSYGIFFFYWWKYPKLAVRNSKLGSGVQKNRATTS